MLCIQNKGEIEIESLFLLGASSKRQDNKKIGMFGSGNKYAIATLLRKEISFKIFSGLNELIITTEKVQFRDNYFNIIYINGEKTSLTTDMGHEWETFFALREFISNSIDEGNYKIDRDTTICPEENITKIYIEDTEEIKHILDNMQNYFCFEEKPREVFNTCYGKVQIYDNFSEQEIFYRKGIRCNVENENKTYFRYNFDDIEINESRVYVHNYEPYERIAEILLLTEDEKIIRAFIKGQDIYKDFKEAKFCYTSSQPSLSWLNVIGNKKLLPVSLSKISSIPREDLLKAIILPDNLIVRLKQFYPELDVYGEGTAKFVYCNVAKEQQDIIDNAILTLWDVGIPLNEKKIKTGSFKDKAIMGMFFNEIIIISENYLKDQHIVETILLEEYVHSLGYEHGTRTYDDFLINCLHSLLHNKKPDILCNK